MYNNAVLQESIPAAAHSTLHTQPVAVLYDGSFDGFLSAIFEATRLRLQVESVVAQNRYVPGLFASTHVTTSNAEQAERVWKGLERKTDHEIASIFRGAFLSELPGIETTLWHYQRHIFRDPTGHIARNILDPHTHTVLATARKVRHEAHLLTGFVRFQAFHDMQIAVIEPQYNTVALLAPHFVRRFPSMPWMILDGKRGIAIHYNGRQVQELFCDPATLPRAQGSVVLPEETPAADPMQKLWQSYYDSINIPERHNPRLMTRLLPRKYWKYLPERNRR